MHEKDFVPKVPEMHENLFTTTGSPQSLGSEELELRQKQMTMIKTNLVMWLLGLRWILHKSLAWYSIMFLFNMHNDLVFLTYILFAFIYVHLWRFPKASLWSRAFPWWSSMWFLLWKRLYMVMAGEGGYGMENRAN
ncbi:hypothetical protein V6N12_062626 [Hibiscus sabdariffa]|uniref:Uncharacterized protein n=1 Tax=Hibiscus sabdariffa TaxID=183260 RepID=A0ABR2F9E8_9ROSI